MRSLAVAFATSLILSSGVLAQSAAPSQSSPQPPPDKEHRRTVFERNGAETPVAATPAQTHPDSITATDEQRSAVLITSFDLDVRLLPQQNQLTVRSLLTIKNDSTTPLSKIPLQISCSLDWVAVRQVSADGSHVSLPLHVRVLDSDIDHTGQVRENVAVLAQPLAPGASLSLEALYAGTVTLNAARLERIGTPAEAAQKNDWDRIAPDFVALRGFGNTLWHPGAAPAALLGDQAKLFRLIDTWRQRESIATMRLRITMEYTGDQPNLTLLDGTRVAVATPGDAATADPAGPHIMTAEIGPAPLGFAAPSIFVFSAQESARSGVRFFAQPEQSAAGAEWESAAANVSPLLSRWLGPDRKRELLVVDLPEPGDAAFALDNVLFHPLRNITSDQMTATLANAMTHVYFVSPRLWLAQGVPQFMSSLWTEQNSGRDTALAELENDRRALALAEPAHGEAAAGQPLIDASSKIYYRTKSAYVLWMLRSLIGDDALAAALRSYRAADDKSPDYLESLCAAESHQDLKWFFNDWVYHDAGLPDLAIAAVHSRAVAGSFLTEIEIVNHGEAAASVPVTIRASEVSATQRLRVNGHGSTVTRFVTAVHPDTVIVNDRTVPETGESHHEQKL